MSDRPITAIVGDDYTDYTCPCGSQNPRHGDLSRWLRKHVDHSNGRCVVHTDAGSWSKFCSGPAPGPDEWDILEKIEAWSES